MLEDDTTLRFQIVEDLPLDFRFFRFVENYFNRTMLIPMVKKRKKMILAVAGVIIAALSFTVDKIVGEQLKTEYDDLKGVEKDFADSLGPETIQYQLFVLQQLLQKGEVEIEKRKPEPQQDFSSEIQEDQITIRTFVTILKLGINTTTSLLKRIDARARDLQGTLIGMQPQLQKVMDNAIVASQPSEAHD